MKTLFFSVDVETSGPCPSQGDLLTLGAVAVKSNGGILEDTLYQRLSYARPIRWEPSCRAFWAQQDPETQRLAYGDLQPTEHCVSPAGAAAALDQWVRRRLRSEECEDACFVAHPAGFDWAFVNALLWDHLGHNVFGYRSLCLRSMGFGLDDRPWGSDRTDESDLYVESAHKHFALADAWAQAEQLARMLSMRARQYERAPRRMEELW